MPLASQNYRSGQPISEYIQNNLAPRFSPNLINPQHFCHSARPKPVRLSKSGLADDFPNVLTTANFSDYCFNNYNTLASADELLKRTTLYGFFSVPRTTTTRRVLALPHPASQLALSRIIADNRKEIQTTIDSAKISLYDTKTRAGVDRAFLGVNFSSKSIKEAEI